MVIVYVILGLSAGFISFSVSIFLGVGFWFAILIYSLVGSITTLLAALLSPALGQASARSLPDRQSFPEYDATDVAVTSGSGYCQQPILSRELGPDGEMKILAVDDDAYILELIPMIAAKVGCPDVTLARSGGQALTLLQDASIPFDCVLLDIRMPEMDGIELCVRIRRMAAYRDIPIIMLTAMTDIDHLESAFRAGASDYTAKPFDIIEFGNRLQIAQARTAARRRDRDVAEARGAFMPDDGNHDLVDVARLVPLPGVAALIEYDALGNYLTRLKGSSLADAFVMAVLVRGNDGTEEGMASNVESPMLKQVAAAIDEVFRYSRCVMACAEGGLFVLVSQGESLPPSAAVEAALQDRLDRQRNRADSVAGAQIAVGMAVRPDNSKDRRAEAAIERAITLAKERAADKQDAFRSRPSHRWI